DAPSAEEGPPLPPLEKGEVVDLVRLIPEQHFTQPPPRYTEATLVKALEEYGIGRPSTYAPILSTIQERGYVARENRHLVPTELGYIVNDLLVQHFPEVVDTGFTARMESDLDRIAEGSADWVEVLREFYGPFERRVLEAEREMPRVQLEVEETGDVCEKCGHPMVVRHGRFGKFIACSNFPACRNTRPYLTRLGVACPECGGELVERRTRRGRTFYGCARYPECSYTMWKRPVPQPCPACGGLLAVERRGWLKCVRCGHQVPAQEVEESASPVGPGA
ncbi:MAG: topoisomerase DNA-binding C4 zinc finger domain-containing protein, partial [Anaerolineae bacterium]|nr:topoisomerase DNA-binding C4 zinc finger domain-containing protein [Anaerolineae bacterium]